MSSLIEISCDESGWEGENLTGSSAPVLSHASVDLSVSEATSLAEEIRQLTGSDSLELKAYLFLGKAKTGRARWFLERLDGRGAVNLTDKRYFVCAKIVSLLIEPEMRSRGEWLHANGRAHRIAEKLYRSASELGQEVLDDLLNAFNWLVRIDRDGTGLGRSDSFFSKVTNALSSAESSSIRTILGLVLSAERYGREIEADSSPVFARFLDMDPLLSSVAATARYWSMRTPSSIRLVHDETSALTPQRIESIVNGLRTPHPILNGLVLPIPLESIALVKSHHDVRVQIADVLAGISRAVASSALGGEVHPLAEGIGSYIDPESMWCDQSSWDLMHSTIERAT